MAYNGNPNLVSVSETHNYTNEELLEFIKCKEDPIYFLENYVKIVNIDLGLINFKPYKYQKKIVKTIIENRYTIVKLPRQSGKSTIVVALMIWLVLFNENYNIAILANKADQSRELLGRIQTAYEHMPKWLQQPVEEWNKGSIELANGSKILAAATSASAVRGKAFNFIYLDEFAFVPRNIQDQFFTSVYPTISSGNTSKIAITSTPNGMDLFYKLWVQSENNKNDYKRIEIHWSDTPGRDEKWREEQIRNTSEIQFQQEFECVSGDTMIEVLDTETNEVKKITIEELYNLI